MKKLILTVMMAGIFWSCATNHKLQEITNKQLTANIAIPEFEEQSSQITDLISKDTISRVKREEGPIIMNAIKDENGEMIATDIITPAKVTARFKNVAERHGQVTIEFDINVRHEMLDSQWQLRLLPVMKIQAGIVPLDSILITGSAYRAAQLKGYQQYHKFIQSIIADSTRFIDQEQLEIFIRRNLPGIYQFKKDSSYVSNEDFSSHYGISEQQAVEHYTYQYRIRNNAKKIQKKEEMYRKYIKVPLVSDGLRLDTVINVAGNNFIYRYAQTIDTQPKLKKITIQLDGAIYESDQMIYRLPEMSPLTYHISSLTSFIDPTEHYLEEIISRKAEANTACYIDFLPGSSRVDPALGNNEVELHRIEQNMKEIAENKQFDLDSIIVTASCSPEGAYFYNERLSRKRAHAISIFLENKMKEIEDSLFAAYGPVYQLGGQPATQKKKYEINYRNIVENWKMLDQLVLKDSLLNETQKTKYFEIGKINDPDLREMNLRSTEFYNHLRQCLYPRARTVLFHFHLHRKNMIQDTILTTIPDTTYRKGVQALADRDYEKAIRILRPYADFNTALAYCAMDYNDSAMNLLESLEQSPKVKYLLALLYSRSGQDKKAVDHYMDACHMDKTYIFRGNLDPEISSLIHKYHLNSNN